MNKKELKLPLLPKPDRFWAVCNRYYDDGETVQFSLMRGMWPRVEGEGKVLSATRNEYGRVSYNVKPNDKSLLKRGSNEEQKKGAFNACLEDLSGGPWRSGEGRKIGSSGGYLPEKLFHINVKINDKGEQTLERRAEGFSEMELFGWLRTISREMEVRLITQWASDPNFCSFCGNHANVSEKLIAGAHNTRICNTCVGTCNEILASPDEKEDATK